MEAIPADRNSLEALSKKLAAAAKNAAYQKARYWRIRKQAIEFLGGCCKWCGEKDPSRLEIHHDPPLLHSEKKNGFPRGGRSGEARIREWKQILAGLLKAILVCHDCHIKHEHHGNTNELKKEK